MALSPHEEEKRIYELAKEYLKKKPLFHLDEIIDFMVNRLNSNDNFNRRKINKLIKALIKKKRLVPGSKLVRDDILEVQKRVEILDFITAMPGTYIKEIMDYNEVGANQAIWHLKYLEKFGFIRSKKFGNQKAYFKANFREEYDEIFFYLRNSKVKKIINLLKETEAINPTEISDRLSIHYNTIRKYLNILKKFNLLVEIDEKHKKEYLLNQDMLDVIQKVIENLK